MNGVMTFARENFVSLSCIVLGSAGIWAGATKTLRTQAGEECGYQRALKEAIEILVLNVIAALAVYQMALLYESRTPLSTTVQVLGLADTVLGAGFASRLFEKTAEPGKVEAE